jgi:very-short-patch-repair endonuclease
MTKLWTVLRFWSNEVKKNLNGCIAIIKETMSNAAVGGLNNS